MHGSACEIVERLLVNHPPNTVPRVLLKPRKRKLVEKQGFSFGGGGLVGCDEQGNSTLIP
jgi:hypothetical protein